MKTRRILSAALAVLMLLPVLAACSDTDAAPGSDITAAPAVADVSVTTDAETTVPPETGVDLSHLPDVKFEGEQIRFLDVNESGPNGKYWATYDIFADAVTGDVINDAVFKRNVWVEERFGVTIGETKVKNVVTEIEKSVNAQNDEYDVVLGNLGQVSSLTTKRYLYELGTEVPHIDLSKPWWDQNQLRDMSVGGKVYYATGDLLVVDNDATFALMFNKDLAADNQIGDLYAMVNEGKWTFDQMYELLSKTTRDLNGDTIIDEAVDQVGISTGIISTEALFFAAGLRQAEKDKDDLPALAVNVEKTATFIEKAYQLCVNPELCYNYNVEGKSADSCKDVFTAGRALFYGETLQGVTRLRSSDVNFGIIPYPKWDEKQEAYYSFQHSVGSALAVPITNTRTEMTGAVLEAMAAKGLEILTPAYYDITLIGKGLRDAESEPMVELILANRVYDLGYVYSWGNLTSTIRTLVQNNRSGIASTMKAVEKLFKNNVNKTLEAIGAGA